MTAEISILNKQALALAADSAVTIGDGAKIFTSAHKIFCLSEDHSIGIMIYGRAAFLGVPWEIIVGEYRKKIGKKKFKSLKEYGKHFLSFVTGTQSLFPLEEQRKYFRSIAGSYLVNLLREIQAEVKAALAKSGNIKGQEVADITSKIIRAHYEKWHRGDFIEGANQSLFDAFKLREAAFIEGRVALFEKLSLTQELKDMLVFIATSIPFRNLYNPTLFSGVVIAGFGEDEYFANLVSYEIEMMTENILKFKEDFSAIDHTNDAEVRAFAQKEMVSSFMEGVHPDYDQKIRSETSKILHALPKMVVDELKSLSQAEKETVKADIDKKVSDVHTAYRRLLDDYKYDTFISQIVGIVGVLPKDDLAMMAESLVNLTSFKRRMSMGSETVGGPIDVAVISKNDGFVWVKRKSYFKKDINSKKI